MKVVLQILGVIFILQIIIGVYFSYTSGKIVILNKPEPPQNSTRVNYYNEEKTNFLKQVLDSMGIEHTDQHDDDGHWVAWTPKSAKIEKEIRERVAQYGFILEVCPNLPLPKPTEQSKSELSCTRE